MAKSKREEKSVELANQILENYQPKTVEDMQNALKDIFGPMFEAMLKGEMDNHLGYESNDKNEKETDNRRNGYGKKTLKTSAGEVDVKVPRDRDGSFDPQLIPKRKKDVSAIENKVISMYARG
ncbi:transposase, partial [Siminovitchia terrae]